MRESFQKCSRCKPVFPGYFALFSVLLEELEHIFQGLNAIARLIPLEIDVLVTVLCSLERSNLIVTGFDRVANRDLKQEIALAFAGRIAFYPLDEVI